MFGGRRGLVAVLAAGSVVLGGAQATGMEVPLSGPGPHALALSGPTPTSPGTTDVVSAASGSQTAAGGAGPRLSADGQWSVFTSIADLQPGNPSASAGQNNIFARNLATNTTVQLSRATTGGNPAPASGSSFQPDITANGRFVAFITQATNIIPAAANTATLVLCDRDPDNNGVFDEAANNGSLTDTCIGVHTGPLSINAVGAVVTTERPTVAVNSSGSSGRIAWTQLTARPGAPGSTAMHVFSSTFSTSGGLAVSAETQVPMTLGTPASCGSGQSGSSNEELSPTLADDGDVVFFLEEFPAGGCEAIASTGSLSFGTPTTRRWDAVPSSCGSGFLGDRGALTGECAGLGGGDVVFLSGPAPDAAGDGVAFRFHDGPPAPPGFVAPRAAAPTFDTDWALVARAGSGNSVSSDILSRNNAGTIVDGFEASLSGDGRYAAFTTDAANTHDGADRTGSTALQVVARDLTLDAGPTRIKGALATPRDPSRPTPNNCAPAADQSCASAGGSAGSLSMDATGGRIAYASSATDLLPADVATGNAYVRTWAPQLADQETPGGTAQTGSTRTFDVPISIASGFGPLSITSTALAGTNLDQFVISTDDDCRARAIHVNDPCTVTVTFQPTSDGTKNADILATTKYATSTTSAASVVATAVPNGPKNAPATNVPASLDPSGAQPQSGGGGSMISGNGRWDVFTSSSDLLGRKAAATEPDRSNVYVRDLADPQTTVQISLQEALGGSPTTPSRPTNPGARPRGANPNGASFAPTISSDGRFVSFMTLATNVAPRRFGGGVHDPALDYITAVVCDRDPDGDGKFDELQSGTQLPDYVCFPVEAGSNSDDGFGLDTSSRPMLAGNRSRITWVESSRGFTTERRVVYADLTTAAGGALQAPGTYHYVPSSVTGFEHGADRNDGSNVEQTQPVLNEDGTLLAYEAVTHPDNCCSAFAVIEADLAAGTDQRVDGLGGDNPGPDLEISDPPAISDDGTRVAFEYFNGNEYRIYVSRVSGGVATSRIESRNNDGDIRSGVQPVLSGDGRYLAFVAQARDMSNGVDPATGGCNDQTETNLKLVCQVVARDLVHDAQRAAAGLSRLPSELVSTARPGSACPNPPAAGRLCGGNDDSSNPSMDNTGSEIGFDSAATNLIPGVDPAASGAYVHTWRPSITSTPIDYGSVKLGNTKTKNANESVLLLASPPEAFGPISLGKSTVTGLAVADYTVVNDGCSGVTLHEGAPDGQPLSGPAESCTIKVRFKPAAPGTRTAALRVPIGKNSFPRVIRDPAPPNAIVQQFDPAAVRTLTGFGATSVVVVNPAILDFGNRRAKDPLTKTVKVTNTGSTALVISGVVVNDTTHPGARNDYTVTFGGCLPAVAPGASCLISVKFSGSKVGVRDAIMIISSNASAGSTTVGLRARVIKPSIDSNPAVSPVRRVITVTGKNFAPNHFVEVGFDDDVQDTVKTDAHGSFELTMVVLPNGRQGPRTLFGHSVGLSKTIRGEFDFLVVLTSSDPGGGMIVRD